MENHQKTLFKKFRKKSHDSTNQDEFLTPE